MTYMHENGVTLIQGHCQLGMGGIAPVNSTFFHPQVKSCLLDLVSQ